jgi:hypothetical protein
MVYAKVAGSGKSMDTPTKVGGREFDSTRDFIKRSAGRMNREVIASAARQNGFKQIRFVTDANCEVEIQEVTIQPDEARASFGTLLNTLVNKYQLFNTNKSYMVYLDTTMDNASGITCGMASNFSRDVANFQRNRDNPDPAVSPYNNSVGMSVFPRVGRNAAAGASRECWVPFKATGNTKPTNVQLHEFMHTLGAVSPIAPNHSNHGHCTDGEDTMCYDDRATGSEPPVNLNNTICKKEGDNYLLDCLGDNYFNLQPRSNNYLNSHWNTANSKWLTSQRGQAQ